MNEKTMHLTIMGGIIVILALLFYSLGEKQIILTTSGQAPTISVTGDAEVDVMPDQVVISLSVLTEGKDATAVQTDNSKKMNQVLAALKDQGVKDSEIETLNYNLYPWQEWDQTTQKLINKGYRAQHTIQVKQNDIKNAGKLLDIAVKNGANTIDNVYFTLSDAKEKEVKEELVAKASLKAKEKAHSLAKNLGISVGKVRMVSQSSYSPPIYYASYAKAEMAQDMAAEPSLSPKSVKVNLQVNVEYGIE